MSTYLETKVVLNSGENIFIEDVEVNILSREEALIQRVIKNEEIQRDLASIASRLSNKKVLEIYTDGSLAGGDLDSNKEKKMGIGWVVVDEVDRNSCISFRSRIDDWPSLRVGGTTLKLYINLMVLFFIF